MAVKLYMDVHVPQAITDQLLRRDVDVLTAMEDSSAELPDELLLERSTALERVIVTFDVRFKAMAEDWQRDGRHFTGLVYAHPLKVSIGHLVKDLECLALATEPEEWSDMIEHLPL